MRRLLLLLAAATAASPTTTRRGALRSLVAAPPAAALCALGGAPARGAVAAAPAKGDVAREALSGLAGGAAQRIAKDVVLYPIDTVKVRLQTAGNRELTRRSLADPYAGALAPLVVGVPSASLFFAVKDGLGQVALNAGFENEFVTEAATVTLANLPYWGARAPVELVKTRQQLARPPRPLGDVAREIYDGKGVGGFYAGAVESYCYAVPADIIKFYSYRALKKKYAGLATSPVATKALLGSAASSIAQLTTTPLDVCKIRAIQAGDRGDVSIPRRIADIARDEGPFELFAGVAPRLARAVVSGALQFGSYELAKSLFR